MMSKCWLFCLGLFLFSCEPEGVKDTGGQKKTFAKESKKAQKEVAVLNSDDAEVAFTEKYSNGIVISWIERGQGEFVKKGDVVMIDYKVTLENGTVVDGNHLLKLPAFPFMTGFRMQTEGWDFALSKMKVGDFARVKIPAKLARGEKGIKGLIPPNAVNYLSIKIVSKLKPTKVVDGVKVWLLKENPENKMHFGDQEEIAIHAMVSTESNPLYYNSYAKGEPFFFRMSDKGIIPGLKKALKKSKKADRMYVYVPASEAYGDKGLEGSVEPGEELFYNILVMDVREK